MKIEQGTTMIEAIVVSVVFGIIAISISAFVVNFYRTYGHTINQVQTVIQAEKAIATMIREIREATTAQDGAYILYNTTDREFAFFSDIDRDDSVELVRYYVEDSKFKREITEPLDTFPPDYSNGQKTTSVEAISIINSPSIFKYYNASGTEIFTTPIRRKDTEMMQVIMIINTNPNMIDDYELNSNVQLRNLKSNI